MKFIIVVVCCLLMVSGLKSQNLFKVISVDDNSLYRRSALHCDSIKYFRIAPYDYLDNNSTPYPLVIKDRIDTIQAIGELLKYRGDDRICVFPIINYNLARSQLYIGNNIDYSIQLEALFIINQLALPKPFNYASYPILINSSNDRVYCIRGIGVKKAFDAYEKWYEILKKKGLSYVRSKSVMPLDGYLVRWY